jgi:hypothetical protein
MAVVRLQDAIALPVANRKFSMCEVGGPASYTQVTAGVPPAGPTGGQIIPATAFGLKFIDVILNGLDESGKYEVAGTSGNKPGGATSVTLMWILAATGAQEAGATNLSTFKVALLAIGR